MILTQLVCGLVLIALTVLAQAFWFDRIARRYAGWTRTGMTLLPRAGRAAAMAFVIFNILLSHLFAVVLWAIFYIYGAGGGAVPLESALYFSISTFAAAPFGDITMAEDWRLVSTLQSLNGLLLMVWSAALLCEIIQRLYRPQTPARDRA